MTGQRVSLESSRSSVTIVISTPFSAVLAAIAAAAKGSISAAVTLERVTYWHVELDRHNVLLAEGMACESYLDTGNRSAFANGGGAIMMQPDFALRVWESKSCAELVMAGAELEAARSFLLWRAEMLGQLFRKRHDRCGPGNIDDVFAIDGLGRRVTAAARRSQNHHRQ